MSRIDGRGLTAPHELTCDVVVVGSGPAGAGVAAELGAHGLAVVLVEAGRWFEPAEFPASAFDAMSASYRDMGASVVVGRAPMPFLQGKMVGGSSPVNGAICWRLPEDVHRSWVGADPALGEALPWSVLESVTDALEERLDVAPTAPEVAGRKNLLMAAGAEALGLEHRPIRRNVSGCRGLGRCMQGCPEGNKLSVDRTLLVDAEATGATILSSVEVGAIVTERGRAVGVLGRADGGAVVRVSAGRAVVVAASAVQTPALLLASGIDQGPVGHHFQGHPGVSMSGRFADPVRMWEGATQGHEVIGLRHEGLKFEALGFGLDVLAARLDGVGRGLARQIEDLAHHVDWGVAVRAEAHGRVRVVRGRPRVWYQPTRDDVARFRRGLRVLGEMMLAAGAVEVDPGVRGHRSAITGVADLVHLETDGPRDPAAFTTAVTHMFGTTRMGSDPATSVVGPDFRHHGVDRLYVADSSVFPTNIGVNPQIPIMALATLCARNVAGVDLDRAGPRPGDRPLGAPDATDATDAETDAGRGPSRVPSPAPPCAPSAPGGSRAVPLAVAGSQGPMHRPSPPGAPMSSIPTRHLDLDDLMAMSTVELRAIMDRAHPLDPQAMAGRQYLGADLSMPRIGQRILWQTFRKAFVRDEEHGDVRGWNVRMEQRGIHGAQVPRRDRDGQPKAFAHFRVRPAAGIAWPRGWSGAHYFDYTIAGNPLFEGLGFTPVVAVNEGSSDLVLGWEIFRVGGRFVAPPLYWAIRDDGPVDVVATPRRAPKL